MYHSITFGDGSLYPSGSPKEGQFMGINTWDDWHLIPSSRPVIASPGVSTNFVEIPGKHGQEDLSEYLNGKRIYGSRSGSFEFYVDNDHEYWETIRMKIMSTIHGKRMRICLEDDPGYYWEGRFSFNEWRSESWNSMIVIDYVLNPYKVSIHDSGVEDIVWDVFAFETDIDWYAVLHSVTLNNTTYSVTIPASDYEFPITVYFVSGSSVTVSFGGITKTVDSNNPSAILGTAVSGSNQLIATGIGVVTFAFREGSL